MADKGTFTFAWFDKEPGFDPSAVTWDKLEETGGYGGFAKTVWRETSQGYAIKKYAIKTSLPAALEGARQEFEAMRALSDCKGATQVLAYGIVTYEDGTTYPVLVEKWVEGHSLIEGFGESKYFSGGRSGSTTLATRLSIAVEVAAALSEVAGRGVVQRDLGPSNVIVLRKLDGTFQATVIDFGQAPRTADDVTPVNEGPRLAQWQFGAPEMYGGEFYGERNEPSVDVWSLGALCWYTLSDGASAPNSGLTKEAKEWSDLGEMQKACDLVVERKRALDGKGLPDDVRDAFGPVGAELSAIVRDCLRFDPSKRPSAKDVADRLRACLAGTYGDPTPVMSEDDTKTPLMSNSKPVQKQPAFRSAKSVSAVSPKAVPTATPEHAVIDQAPGCETQVGRRQDTRKGSADETDLCMQLEAGYATIEWCRADDIHFDDEKGNPLGLSLVTDDVREAAGFDVDNNDEGDTEDCPLGLFFVTDETRAVANLDEPYILLMAEGMLEEDDIGPILDFVKKNDASLLIIEEDYDIEAIVELIDEKLKGKLKVCVVEFLDEASHHIPNYGNDHDFILKDLATLTGAKVVRKKRGVGSFRIDPNVLGRADRVCVESRKTCIFGGRGERQKVLARIKSLKDEESLYASDFYKEKLDRRIAELSRGIGVDYVSAPVTKASFRKSSNGGRLADSPAKVVMTNVVKARPGTDEKPSDEGTKEDGDLSRLLKSAANGDHAAQYELGIRYTYGVGVERDDVQGFVWYRKAADGGLVNAQNALAFCYHTGCGVSRDYAEAARWYRKAAERGLAIAQCSLAVLYERGQGVSQGYVEAARWYRKAAEQGLALAQCSLGLCYEAGQGVERDYAEAARWYRKAAEQDDASAQFYLGLCYEKGKGVERDYAEAVRWYRKSAEQGDAKAQRRLGFCFAKGMGVEQDYVQSATWYRKSAEQGDAVAQVHLGLCYEDGKGVERDYAEAARWYRKSAEQGNASAQLYLGFCFAKGMGVEQDYVQSATWYRKSAEQGDAVAQNNLGVYYHEGHGVPQDYAEAVRWYRKAAEQGEATAQEALAKCYLHGWGVKKDEAEAYRWFQRAAEQGNVSAKRFLDRHPRKVSRYLNK